MLQMAPARSGIPAMVVQRRENKHEVIADLPATLAELGCDEELWHGMRNSGRKSLKQLLRNGKEELARQRIAKMTALINNDDSSPVAGASAPAPAVVKSWYDSGARLEPETPAAPAAVVETVKSAATMDATSQSAPPKGFEWGGTF